MSFIEVLVSLIIVVILVGPLSMFTYQSKLDAVFTREISKADDESNKMVKEIRSYKINEGFTRDTDDFIMNITFIENSDKVKITLESKKSKKIYTYYSYVIGDEANWLSN